MDNPPAGEDASAEDIAALKQAEKERKIQKRKGQNNEAEDRMQTDIRKKG